MPATSSVFRGHPFRVALWTLKGVALAHVGFTHVVSAAPGWGPSMLPTFLVDGQWFVVDRRCRRGRGVAVGDCVLYAIPVVSPGTTGGGTEGVKRVVGLPGDYVLLNSPGAKSEAMMQVSSPCSQTTFSSETSPSPTSNPKTLWHLCLSLDQNVASFLPLKPLSRIAPRRAGGSRTAIWGCRRSRRRVLPKRLRH